MTFCSPFPPTAVATSRQERGKKTEMHRERRIKHSEKEGDMMRRKRSDDRSLTCTFASAYYFYPVPFNCCRYILSLLPLSSPPSISALIFLPVSLRKPTQALALPAGSTKVCGGGLAVSNEIPSVRFQTSTASLASSNTGTKWWTGRGYT